MDAGDNADATGNAAVNAARGRGRQEGPPVTVEVARRAKPGREEEFEHWLSEVVAAASVFPGYAGADVFKPQRGPEYRLVLRFDGLPSQRRWETSEERRRLDERGEALARDAPRRRVATGLEAWFTLPGSEAVEEPPAYKMFLLTWAAVFALSMIATYALGPLVERLPVALGNLLVTGIIVALLTWVVMPRATRLFATWLYPGAGESGGGP